MPWITRTQRNRRVRASTTKSDSASCASSTVCPCRSSSACTDQWPRRSLPAMSAAQVRCARTSARARIPARCPTFAAPDRCRTSRLRARRARRRACVRAMGAGRGRVHCGLVGGWAISARRRTRARDRYRRRHAWWPRPFASPPPFALQAPALLFAAVPPVLSLRWPRRAGPSGCDSFAMGISVPRETPRRRAPPCSRSRPTSRPADTRDRRRRPRRIRPAPTSRWHCLRRRP